MIGKTVSHYTILEKLGSGGMGDVYKAEDTRLKRMVALKFLPPELTRNPEAKARFINEAQATSALEHNNICNIHNVEEMDDGQLFIVMAYYEGQTLKQKIEQGPLKIEEALDISIQIAKGLDKSHKEGIVHRDIKPANILITEDGFVKILDFGLAKLAGQTKLTKTGTTLGTVAYMSPEQAKGGHVDHRTDIWSLGVILYEMLTGRLPFKGDYDQAMLYSIINEKPDSIRSINKEIPVEFEAIIGRSLQKSSEKRYSNLGEWIDDLKACIPEKKDSRLGKRRKEILFSKFRKPVVFTPVIFLLCFFCIWIIWTVYRLNKIKWATEVAIPEIERLVDGGWLNAEPAFELAKEASNYLPDNPRLKNLLSRTTRILSVSTEPPGARIYKKPYMNPDDEWEFMGTTPIEKMEIPFTLYNLKIEKPNYETIIMLDYFYRGVNSKTGKFNAKRIHRKLDPLGTLPKGMAHIRGSDELPEYFMDKYEVTNIKFKVFVDAGGYENETYWKEAFIRNGKVLTWIQAMKYFKDSTGRPGPASWQAGDYPEGQDNYPVSGISWYEAVAFAEFSGKRLPTVNHWGNTIEYRTVFLHHYLISQSNFNQVEPIPVGQSRGITSEGLYDMAGNVREWCWNESSLGRCIRGGAWNDAHYMYMNISQADPFDRSMKNGFRCVIYPDSTMPPEQVFQKYEPTIFRDYNKEEPVSYSIFQIYKSQFAYDETGLQAKVISIDTTEDWITQKIDFNTAYEDESMSMYLFLPKNAEPPFQTVVYFPGADSHAMESSANINTYYEVLNNCSFFLKNGRAVCYPIYKGTFERRDISKPSYRLPTDTYQHKEYMIKVVKDCSRSIDYLQTRADVNIEKLAYVGYSWGAWMGNIILALEDRFKVAILTNGGLRENRWSKPEVDPINFITMIRVPTLMLNGKYDYNFPYDLSVEPMYRLMGTPKEHKKLILYETDHFIPGIELIKESLDWLDKYLGPIK